MKTNDAQAGVAPTYSINGNTALSTSFSHIQRNRSSRFEMDLSQSTVVGILQAYEARMQKSNPKYSMNSPISILRSIEESERKAVEMTKEQYQSLLLVGPKKEIKDRAYLSIERIMDGLEGKIDKFLQGPVDWAGPFLPVDICSDFWVAFENFIVNVPGRNGKKRHSSTATGYANKIVAALAWSRAYGVSLDPTFRDFHFSRYEKKKITPSDDQISLIYHFNLDVKEVRDKIKVLQKDMHIRQISVAVLKKVRDHFVLSCSLGQRISDSTRFDRSNFEGSVFETTQQKTGNHAKLDVQQSAIDWDVAKEILDRYEWKAPAYGMDTNRFNKLLHLLCRLIGGPFNQIVTWSYKEGGEIYQESAPVWKLITSHVARRTFITREIQRGVTMPEIMRKSGHSDVRNMFRYYAPDHN